MSFSPHAVNKNLTFNLSFAEKQEEETIVALSEQPSLLLAPHPPKKCLVVWQEDCKIHTAVYRRGNSLTSNSLIYLFIFNFSLKNNTHSRRFFVLFYCVCVCSCKYSVQDVSRTLCLLMTSWYGNSPWSNYIVAKQTSSQASWPARQSLQTVECLWS